MTNHKVKRLLGKRILVDLLPRDEKTDGGIIIAETVALMFAKGIVMVIGDDVPASKVQVGDTVLIPENKFEPVKNDGKDQYMYHLDDVQMVLE